MHFRFLILRSYTIRKEISLILTPIYAINKQTVITQISRMHCEGLIAFPDCNSPLRDSDRSFNRLVKFRNRLMEAGIVWSQRTMLAFTGREFTIGSDDMKFALPGSCDANCITAHRVFSILSKCLTIVECSLYRSRTASCSEQRFKSSR